MSIKLFHRYLGLVLSLIILSISFTGVILVWKKEYLWLTVEGARETIDTSLLASAIDNIEARYAQDEVIFIQLYSEDLTIHKVFLKDQRYAWHNQHGNKIQEWSGNQRWEDLFLNLHRRFLLGNTIGSNIVGLGGLLILPLIVLGFLIWWPRRNLFSLRSLLKPSFKRKGVLPSHGDIGAVFVLPILVLVFTGVILVYPVESRIVLLESFGQGGPAATKTESFDVDGGFPTWASLIQIARQKFPESSIRSVQPSSTTSAKRAVNLQQKQGWHRLGRTSLKFHANGTLVIKDELAQSTARRALSLTYPLHTAKLGLFYRIVVTLVGIVFFLLCVLGLVSYLKRR